MEEQVVEKIHVHVYADHMSSGLWDIDGRALAMPLCIPEPLRLALKYWHEIWEFAIADDRMSSEYKRRWWHDGLRIVDNMNKVQDKYNFHYGEMQIEDDVVDT